MTRILLNLLCMLLAVPAALAQPTVSAVRVGEHPDKTRFVMELSEKPRYRVSILPDPFRVLIDLQELVWKPRPGGLRERDGLISAMHFGLLAPGTSRVVLDVTAAVRVKSVFVIPAGKGYPHRFVVDLARVSREDFFAGAFAGARGRPIVSDPPLELGEAQQPARAPASPPKMEPGPEPKLKSRLLVAPAQADPSATQQATKAPPPPPKMEPAPSQPVQTELGAGPPPLSALARELTEPALAPERPPVAEPPPPLAKSLTQQTATQTQTTALPPLGPLVNQVRVLFQGGSARLSDSATAQLVSLAKQLSQDTSARIQLLAYAKSMDGRPSKARRLSLSRALAVRAFLIDQGVRSTRMDVRALGDKVQDGPSDRVDIAPRDARR